MIDIHGESANLERVRCDLCSGSGFTVILPAYARSLGLVEEMHLIRCKRCGLIVLYPRLTWSELAAFYPESYYLQNSKIGIVGRLKSTLESSGRGTVLIKGGRLLDVGCGNGDYLTQIEKRGMKAFGLEPGLYGFRICKSRGLNVTNSFLENSRFPDQYFDVVTLNHVLEHVPSPLSTLLAVKRILRSNGIVIIQVPNLKSFAFYVSREHYLHLDVPRHLFHFDKSTLTAYIEKAGLRVERVRYYSSAITIVESLWLRQLGKRSVSGHAKDVASRNSFVFTLVDIAFTPIRLLLNKLELGDAVEVYASKT